MNRRKHLRLQEKEAEGTANLTLQNNREIRRKAMPSYTIKGVVICQQCEGECQTPEEIETELCQNCLANWIKEERSL